MTMMDHSVKLVCEEHTALTRAQKNAFCIELTPSSKNALATRSYLMKVLLNKLHNGIIRKGWYEQNKQTHVLSLRLGNRSSFQWRIPWALLNGNCACNQNTTQHCLYLPLYPKNVFIGLLSKVPFWYIY